MSRRKRKDFFQKYDYSKLASTTPVCEHFGSCGGCSFQNIAYEDQIKLKEEYLGKLFQRIVSIQPNKNPFEYRNRMDFIYQHGKLGFRKKGDFKTAIPISTCHLIPKKAQDIFSQVQDLLQEYSFNEYGIESHEGFLRYIVFRYAQSTNELMVIITTSPPKDEEEKQLEEFMSKIPAKSVYWFINDTVTDISLPFVPPHKIQGSETITETIGSYSYNISPFSFFQANTSMSKQIFDDIKKEVSGTTVDLCCGVGSIGIYVSEVATSITGIEEVEVAIELAKENAKENNVTNATFFASDMKNILNFTPLEVNTLIVDPPRAGLGKKVIKRIQELAPDKIIYMSCNPKTQKIDKEFLEDYELSSLQGYDQFSHTPHIETLAIFLRK